MKKLLLSMFSISALLFSTACSDEDIVKGGDGEKMVQFTVSLNDGSGASRSISDGQTVDKVYYEVYTNVNGTQTPLTALKSSADLQAGTTATGGNKHATITLALVKGQTYDVVFWASKDGVYNTSDLTSIKVNEGNTNDESKDAFTAVKQVTVNGPLKETVYLYRPFAQINFGTKDILTAIAAGATLKQSSIKVTYAADTYNALAEEGVGEGKTVEFGMGQIPNISDEELTLATGESYEYLATAYVLFPGKKTDKVTTDLTLTVPTGLNKDVVIEVPYAPAQRNYRTNVLGNLLTNSSEFTVIVDPIYRGDYNPEIWTGDIEEVVENNGVYEIENGAQLAWVAAKSNENHAFFAKKEIKLVNDIVLNSAWTSGHVWDNTEYGATFNGNGHTIFGLTAPLFTHYRGTVKDLVIEKATIESNGELIATFATNLGGNLENVTVKNSTLKAVNATADTKRWGGIVGLHMSGNAANCLAENVTITGVTETAGGITGTINEMSNRTYENCVTKNSKVEAGAEAGAVIGEILVANVKLINCSQENTTPVNLVGNGNYSNETGDVIQVKTLAELQEAIDNATGNTEIVFGANIAGNATIKQKSGVNLVINGSANEFDGQFTVNGDGRHAGTETLTFTNIHFYTAHSTDTKESEWQFIVAPQKIDGTYNYSHNVTIENCEFKNTVDGVYRVAGAAFTGTYNFVMKNCTATNMHSLLQVQSCDNTVLVDNVKVIDCKNGVSFGNTAYPTLKNSTIEAVAYGVRGDGEAKRGNLVIENTAIKAAKPIIIRKLTSDSYSVKLDAATKLEGAETYDVVFTNGDDEAEYVAPTGTWSIEGADNYTVFPKFTTAATGQDVIDAIKAGKSVVLADNVNVGTDQLALDGDVTIDLNGKKLTTEMTYGGMSLKNGASIKNGVIEHTSTVAAIKAFNAGSIEDVTIVCSCTTANKVVTGIAVQQGGYVGTIKNVTVEGASQCIEVPYQATVDLIENVNVAGKTNGTAVGQGLLINGGKVVKAVNSTFKGDDYGVHMHLKGEFDVSLELVNCVAEGTTASIYAWDEKNKANAHCSTFTLTYDADTKLIGDLIWDFEEECKDIAKLNAPN